MSSGVSAWVNRRRSGLSVRDGAITCDGPRSQRDYLELARRFAVVFLSGIPRMGPDMGDQARRFTWLVDILYDHRVKLVASAAVQADAHQSHEDQCLDVRPAGTRRVYALRPAALAEGHLRQGAGDPVVSAPPRRPRRIRRPR